MKLTRLFLVVAAAVALCLSTHPAHAQVLLNGSFENPQSTGTYNSATDWTTSSVQYLQYNNFLNNGNGTTPYGSEYVYLAGGNLMQTISGFTAGETYVLGADFASEADFAGTFTLAVSGAATASTTFILTPGGPYKYSTIPFQSGVLTFTASSSGTATISLFSSAYGVAVDNVALYGSSPTTPEPSTYAELLLGLGALAGVGLMRRRSVRA